MLWPRARAGHTDVTFVRAWIRAQVIRTLSSCGRGCSWPLALTGRMDVSSCGHGCFAGHSRALVARALSSRGHGCFGRARELITRTLSSLGHGCSRSRALVTRTLSSCGHGCSGHSRALVTRMLSSCGRGCCCHSPALVTGKLHSCGHGCSWPLARAGHTDVIIEQQAPAETSETPGIHCISCSH